MDYKLKVKRKNNYVFVLKFPKGADLISQDFFVIQLVLQVLKPDRFGPKPDFEHVDRDLAGFDRVDHV